jgi:hypothetical protein
MRPTTELAGCATPPASFVDAATLRQLLGSNPFVS